MYGKTTDAQAIEFFHLVFLAVMQGRLDQTYYVLKGGANLRYFFDSDRYSQDIDLDAVEIEKWRLEEKIDQIFESPAIRMQLERAEIAIGQITKPKQTETTQRWKLSLQRAGRQSPVHTKIEFSHRGHDNRCILEAVPIRVTHPYALRPPTVLHYTCYPALEQKIAALAQRSETQARDVFDIELLLRQLPEPPVIGQVDTNHIEAAIERARELPFEAFNSQVAPFLDPDIADQYDRQAWEAIRTDVVEGLGGLQ